MQVLRAVLVFAIGMAPVGVIAAGPAQTPSSASVSGTASDINGHVTANTAVQLRSASTGQLAGRTTTNASGQFSFAGLNPGTYVVEVVGATGQIVGTSGSIAVGAGAAVTGVSVTTSLATKVAAGGFASHHVALILGAAAAAGVAGGIAMAANGTASPSQ